MEWLEITSVLFILLLIIFITTYIFLENKKIVTTTYEIKSNKINGSIKLVHLSDLHNGVFDNLGSIVSNLKPDIIVITGDLIDKRRTDIDSAMAIIDDIKMVAPIYFVTGNHEAKMKNYHILKELLFEKGVKVIENDSIDLGLINLIGLNDVNFFTKNTQEKKEYLNKELKRLDNQEKYNVLLSHKPNYIDIYQKYNIDLVLSGHVHGGQFRILNHGLYGPDQGILPKYDSGLYIENDTRMIVSRGLGNSLFPFRLFNNPEIVVVEIKESEDL